MPNFEQIEFKNGEAPYLSEKNLNELQTRINTAFTKIDEILEEMEKEI